MTYDLDAFDEGLFEEAKNIMGGKFGMIIEMYLEDTEMYIEKIKEGMANDNIETVAQHAHPLKSSSHGLGVISVSLIAKDLEYGAKDAIEKSSDTQCLKELVELISEAFKRAKPRLKERVG